MAAAMAAATVPALWAATGEAAAKVERTIIIMTSITTLA